uniref:Uncharacterized protein n=1 Tax=Siphoviridae sp. ctvok7 TaxID=2827596 RepID=A0A8S5LLD7_9CAUD|nr:MAG TPA: hypothetical protein [Siphoviridae sp. ctvok7]
MFVLPKRNVEIPWVGGTVRLTRGTMTAIPDAAAETAYFKALVADGKVVPSDTSDRETQAAHDKPVKTRRGKAVTEE